MVKTPDRMKQLNDPERRTKFDSVKLTLRNILIYEPHNMLISGDTNYVLDLIESYYLGKFNYILILCPTLFF
jgi:hypothetical protein